MISRTFDFHSEAFMLVYRNGLIIKEIPITYVYTNSSLSYKVIVDSVSMLLNMLISPDVPAPSCIAAFFLQATDFGILSSNNLRSIHFPYF